MSERPANPNHARFVEEYLLDLNGTQAAIRAGYSAKTANVQAVRLLKTPEVKAAIDAAIAARSEDNQITQKRILKELGRLAFFDIRRLVDADGYLLSLKDLDDDTAAAISGLDIVRVGNREVGVGEIVKFKLADKKGSLELLARHFGMLKDNLKVEGEITVNPLSELFEFLRAGQGRIVPGKQSAPPPAAHPLQRAKAPVAKPVKGKPAAKKVATKRKP